MCACAIITENVLTTNACVCLCYYASADIFEFLEREFNSGNIYHGCDFNVVAVCVCLFPFTERLLLTEQNHKCSVRVQISDGILGKSFCIKYLCRHVIDNHSRDLQAGNCKRVSIKAGKATRSQRQLL